MAGAQILEGFEHGNMGLYTQTGGANNVTLVGAAAHDGSLGARFTGGVGPTWYYRTSVATSPGNSYFGFFRFGAGSTGRIYMGVGATAGGTYSAVAGSNTNQILLQNNTGYGFTTVSTASFTFATDTWYVLHLDWTPSGDMTVRLFNESHTTQLAATPTASTGFTTPGGFAMRGFMVSSTVSVDFDSFSVVPEPGTLIALGIGVAALARRRRSRA
jgi:hypothetical protein